MAVDEQARLALLARLNETLGPEHASTLMASLPAREWTDLATRDDILLLKNDILLVKDDLRAVEARLQDDLRGVERRLRSEIENAEHRLLTVMHREFTVQTRIYVLAIISTVIALSSVTVFTS